MRYFWVFLLVFPGLLGAESEPKPLWEAGVFVGAIFLPDYPGSDEYRIYAAPTPALIYRGKFLQSDRDGVRGIFFKTEHLETNISLYVNPPSGSANKARQDMPRLDGSVEIGPSLKWSPGNARASDPFFFLLAWRAGFSVDTRGDPTPRYRGHVSGLHAVYQNRTWFSGYDTRLDINLSLGLGDSRYHQYVYGVDERYSRPDRPAYTAGSGYRGVRFSAGLSRDIRPDLTLMIYGRWDNLTGAVFTDSPLVKTRQNYILGAALVWRFLKSDKPSWSP